MIKYTVREFDMERFYVLKKVLDGEITLRQASMLLGLSYRHTIRLKQNLSRSGLKGILRKNPRYPRGIKFNKFTCQRIIQLRKELYYDFNVLHFRDKLRDVHNISIGYETLRQMLIKAGLHQPRKRRKIYRRRRRMPQAGLLVQMDSSQHHWLENIPQPWWLVAMCDDADNFVYAEFHPAETTSANMQVLKRFIEIRGLFACLYVDKASHFKTTRHGGLHYDVDREHDDTQIQRALRELGIEIIFANSPQARGRIERLFRLLQDRLIKEMRLAGIKDYASANEFLKDKFLPWYNKRYTLKVQSAYKPLPGNVNLELVFSCKYRRKVNKDNTIRFEGKVFQLLASRRIRSLAGKYVQVCRLLDGSIKVLYEDNLINYLATNTKKSKSPDAETILSKRQYCCEVKLRKPYKPPPEHPWRRAFSLTSGKDSKTVKYSSEPGLSANKNKEKQRQDERTAR